MQKQGTALHHKWPEHPAKEDFTDLAEAANGMKVKRGNQCKARNFLEVRHEVQFNCTAETTVRKERS